MTNKSTMLLEHNLKQLKLPTFLREYDKLASQCASEGADHPDYLLRLSGVGADRPSPSHGGTSDQSSPLPDDQESRHLRLPVYAVPEQGSGSGAGTMRVHRAPPQRHRSRQQWHRQDPYRPRSRSGCVSEGTVRGLHHRRCSGVHELIEARDERRLLNLQRRLARLKLLIIDELGFVPLSKTGAELLFEVFSQRYERGSVLVTSNLPFVEWTEVFGSERLTGALLDRLTHHVDILEMNGDSYRLKHSRKSNQPRATA